MNEHEAVLTYLRAKRDHWRRQAIRFNNALAIQQACAKAAVIDGILTDLEAGYHLRAEQEEQDHG